jgi:hypothetical protein
VEAILEDAVERIRGLAAAAGPDSDTGKLCAVVAQHVEDVVRDCRESPGMLLSDG